MKKYLLLIISMVCAVTGAWAVNFGTGSSYTIDGTTITINVGTSGDFATWTGSLNEESTPTLTTVQACTSAIFTGALNSSDASALNTSMTSGGSLAGITSLDLSGTTGMTQTEVNDLAVPTAITRLTLPEDMVVAGSLKALAANCTGLDYIYSPSSSTQDVNQAIADYVWVNKAGGLKIAATNEATLRTAVYVKIESETTGANAVALNNDDANFGSFGIVVNDNTDYPWQYLDLSGTIVTAQATLAATAPHGSGYRIILPDGLTGDNMAIFASNPNHGLVAAVYSYTGTTLRLMEITEANYKQNALADSRIVKDGTTAIEIVEGEYNGHTYGRDQFGANILAAINGAKSSVTSVTIAVSYTTLGNIEFTNTNLTSLTIKGIENLYTWTTGPHIKVIGCTSLQSLNLTDSFIGGLDAYGTSDNRFSSLTAVNLNGTVVKKTSDTNSTGNVNLSYTGLTIAGLSTSSDTEFTGDLNLTGTALSTFFTTAKVTGDIYLDDCTSLTGADLRQVQFQNTASIIYLRKATSGDDANVLTGNISDEGIRVTEGFAKTTRIIPYVEAKVKGDVYVAPACEKSATDLHLHTANMNSDGDNFVYYYSGDAQTDKMLTISMTDDRRGTLSTILSDAGITNATELVKVKIVGPLASNDLTALASLNTEILDLSEATLQKETSGTYTDDPTILVGTSASPINTYVKFLVLPDGATRENLVNATSLAGFTGLYTAIEEHVADSKRSITAYVKQVGTLQPAMAAMGLASYGTWTRNGKSAYTPDVNNKYQLISVTLSGNLNAYDMSAGQRNMNSNGHFVWDNPVVDEMTVTETDPRNLNGSEAVYGAFSGAFNIEEIDLRDALFTEIGDMTLSTAGLLCAKTWKVVIPTSSSITETPAWFINSNGVKEICIPSNIETIRTRFAPSIDHIWTTATSGDTENTLYDNGVFDGTKDAEGNLKKVPEATGYTGYIKTNNPYAMDYFAVQTKGYPCGTYTFSSNLKLIESNAFANTEPHVKDVYVLATTAPECHVNAFPIAMYVGNSGFSPNIVDGVITRDSYLNGANWIAMLHYPRECVTPNVQRYTDPTRKYTTASNEVDGKGGVLYYPNFSEFLAAYAQGTTGYLWNAWNQEYQYGQLQSTLNIGNSPWTEAIQKQANDTYLANPKRAQNPYTSFYDVTANGLYSQPEGLEPYYNIYWDERTLSTSGTPAQHLYPAAETSSTEKTYRYLSATEDDFNNGIQLYTYDNSTKAYTAASPSYWAANTYYKRIQKQQTNQDGSLKYETCSNGLFVQATRYVEAENGDYVRSTTPESYTATQVPVDGTTYYTDNTGNTEATPKVANGLYYQDGVNNTYATVDKSNDAIGAKDAYYTLSNGVYTPLSDGLPFETNGYYCYKTGEEEVTVYINLGGWRSISYILSNSNSANVFYKKNNDGTYEQYWPLFNNNGDSNFRLYYQDANSNWQATDRMVQGLTADKYFYRDGEEGHYSYRSAENQGLDGTDVYYDSGTTTTQNTYSEPQTYYSSGKTWYTYNIYDGTYSSVNLSWYNNIVNQDYYYATGVTTPNIVSADNTDYVEGRTYYTDATGETVATTVTFDQNYYIPVYGYTTYNASTDEGKTRYNLETYYRAYVAATDGSEQRYCPVMEDYEFPAVTKSNDYRGWHQFVLNAFAANTTEDVVPLRSYITDSDWWTICLPYNLTYKEMMLFYGDVSSGTPNASKIPQLCVLTNVVRDESKRHITLNFSSNLMENRYVYDTTKKVWVLADGTNGADAGKPIETEVVLYKGVPYLIKPVFEANANRQFDVYGGGSVNEAFSEGRIAVTDNDYPGLADKLAKAQLIAGDEFREMMEQNIYTVPALLPAGENFEYSGTENALPGTENQFTIGTKKYVRSADFDYTFVGSLAKAIIPPFSYFLGWNGRACFIYADYTTQAFEDNKTENTPDYKNMMLWNNNSCVICPNMLSSSATNAGYYNLGKGSHKGLVTEAESDGTAGAQWKIYGTNVTPILDDDLYHSSSVPSAVNNAPMMMLFGMNMSWNNNNETTSIRVDGVEINPTPTRVYSMNGQYVGDSLEGLAKGIYIMNGKKIVVN